MILYRTEKSAILFSFFVIFGCGVQENLRESHKEVLAERQDVNQEKSLDPNQEEIPAKTDTVVEERDSESIDSALEIVIKGPKGITNLPSIILELSSNNNLVALEASDFNLRNADLLQVEGSEKLWNVTIVPVADGPMSVTIPPDTIEDDLGNMNSLVVAYEIFSDRTRPQPVISGPENSTDIQSTSFNIGFGEAVEGFSISDINVENGIATNLSTTEIEGTFAFDVTPSGRGIVLIGIDADVANDSAGNPSLAAMQFTHAVMDTEVSSDIAVTMMASRTSGVAPLFVQFDATATVATGVMHPFHELDYHWNFGDSGAGQWAFSLRDKNEARGAVAGHVFETPGTYQVFLTVRSPSGGISTTSETITVGDPDVVYAGLNTICVSASGLFDQCPVGARQVSSSDFDETVVAESGTGKRVLFRRGDTFAASETSNLNFAGPYTLGAFGSGALPVIDTADYGIIASDLEDPLFKNARIMDLEFRGPGSSGMIFGLRGLSEHVLLLRLKGSNFHKGFQFSGGPVHNYMAMVECDVENIGAGSGGNIAFAAANNSVWLGNRFEDSEGGEHVLRVDYSNKTVVSHNYLSRPAETKSSLTMRCTESRPQNCRFWIVSDNQIHGGFNSPWTSGFGNGSSRHTDQSNDIIIERNHYVGGALTGRHISTFADEVTVRNNTFDMNGNVTYGVVLTRRGDEGPHINNWAYNNTCYSIDSSNDEICVSIEADVSQSFAVNNLLVAPNTNRPVAARDENGSNVLDSNLVVANPGFVSATPSQSTDFALTQASVDIIDKGTNVGIAIGDYFFNQRCWDGDGLNGSECDVGAFEYNSQGY